MALSRCTADRAPEEEAVEEGEVKPDRIDAGSPALRNMAVRSPQPPPPPLVTRSLPTGTDAMDAIDRLAAGSGDVNNEPATLSIGTNCSRSWRLLAELEEEDEEEEEGEEEEEEEDSATSIDYSNIVLQYDLDYAPESY
jgi:hypothetical protein